jgi:O-antigen/teichoic acid export membrane protein
MSADGGHSRTAVGLHSTNVERWLINYSRALMAQTTPPPEGRGGAGVMRNSVYSLAAQLSSAAFTAILTLYLVRALGPTRYGVFALAVGIGMLILLPSDFGISSATARFVAERRRDPKSAGALIADSLRLKLVFSIAVCGVLFACAAPIAHAYGQPLTTPIRAIALALLGQNIITFFSAVFNALERMQATFRVMASEGAVEATASIALVLLGAGTAGAAFGRAIGYLAGGGLAVLIGARVTGWPRHRHDRSPIARRKLMGYASALIIIDGAFTLFNQIDVLLIGAYLTAAKVAVFQAPLRLMTFLYYPGYALANGVVPRLARGDSEPDVENFTRALRYVLVFQAAFLPPIIVWAQPIVHVLLGNGYGGAVPVLRVLAASVYLSALAPLVSLAVNYLGEARRRIPIVVGAVALNTVIDVILIPKIGPVSGSIATGAAYLVLVGGQFWVCQQILGFPTMPLLLSLLRALLAAAIASGVLALFGLNPSVGWIIVGALAGTLAFAGTILATREFSMEELRSAAAFARSLRSRRTRLT